MSQLQNWSVFQVMISNCFVGHGLSVVSPAKKQHLTFLNGYYDTLFSVKF